MTKTVGYGVLPLLVFEKQTSGSEHKTAVAIDQTIASLQAGGYLIQHAPTLCPLRLYIRIHLERVVEQVTKFAVYITAADCYFVAVGRQLKLVYDVNYSLTTYEQVEVGSVF